MVTNNRTKRTVPRVPQSTDTKLLFGETPNPSGQQVAYLVAESPKPPTGVAVIASAYERRMHNYAAFSHSLLRHGLHTIRFDLTDHSGMSDGEIVDLTMTSIAEDVATALQLAQRTYPDLPVVLLAPSLTGRAAVRSLGSLNAPITGVILVLPVVDVKDTIAAAANRDLLGEYRDGVIPEGTNVRVVDHDISTQFARDAWEQGWTGLEGTSAELANLTPPLRAIVAEQDEWVTVEDVIRVLTDAGADVTVLEATSHDLAHNLPVMREVLRLAVNAATALVGVETGGQDDLPEFDELVDVITTERALAKEGYASLGRAPVAA